jgi:hypothetical protein
MVSLELQICEGDTHLSIKAVGQYSLAALYDLIDRVKEETEKRALQGVILDVTEVTGTVPVLDSLALGEHFSRVWRLPFRIAIVSSQGGVDKFFENVAWNRGVPIVVVPNHIAAIAWVNWEH